MKKKWKYLIASVSCAIVLTIGICLAVILPKNTKADIDSSQQASQTGANISESETITGANLAPASEKGGSIYLEKDATFTMTGGEITGHSKRFGGAVYISSGAEFVMEDGFIYNNRACYGGAIYVENGGLCHLKGGKVYDNGAEGSPAIHLEPGARLIVDDPSIIGDNYHIEFGYSMNYYVDGVLFSVIDIPSEERIIPFSLETAPLSYNEINGYYVDENCEYPLEDNDNMYVSTARTSTIKTAQKNVTEATKIGVPVIKNGKINVFAKDATLSKNYLNFENNGEGYTVSAKDLLHTSSLTNFELVVPRQYNNTDVYKIENLGYNSPSLNVTNVLLPNSVKEIGDKAFKNLTNLKIINLPNSLEKLGETPFIGSSVDCLFIPKNVQEMKKLFTVDNTAKIVYFESDDFEYGEWSKLGESLSVVNFDLVARFNYTKEEMKNELKAFETLQSENQSFTIKYGILTSYSGEESKVQIPSGVIAIYPLIKWKEKVSSVFIPNSVETIESYINSDKKVYLPFKGLKQVVFENENSLLKTNEYYDVSDVYVSVVGTINLIELNKMSECNKDNFMDIANSVQTGSETNPYLIGSYQDLLTYIQKYAKLQANSDNYVKNYGSAVRLYQYNSSSGSYSLLRNESHTLHFKLTSDIDFSEAKDTDEFGDFASWSIDGNGYSFKNLDGNVITSGIFYEVFDFELKNITVTSQNRIANVVSIIRGGKTYFTDITLDSAENEEYVYLTANDSNMGLLVSFVMAGETYYTNVVNNADYMSLASYFGIFIGGYARYATTSVYFESCVNNGNITSAGTAGVFFGNGAREPGVWQLTNCVNNGNISSKTESHILASYPPAIQKDGFDFSDEGEVYLYDSTVDGCLQQNGEIMAIESRFSAEIDGQDIVISSNDGNLTNGRYKVIIVSGASFKPTDGGDSSCRFPLTFEFEVKDVSEFRFENMHLTFIDKQSYNANGFNNIDSWTDYSSYKYGLDIENGYIVFDTNGEWYMPEKFIGLFSYTIVATDETGKIIDFVLGNTQRIA